MPTVEQLQLMLEDDPNDVFMNFGLAVQLAREGRHEESLAAFDRVTHLDPDYLAAYHQKGLTLIEMRQADPAKKALAAGIEIAGRVGNNHLRQEMQRLLDSISCV